MLWARRLWLRLQTLFRRSLNVQRLDDEMHSHLEPQIAENIAAGMNAEEARYAAMRTFGNPAILKEETRDTRGWVWLEQTANDFRYAARMLRKSPGFTAVAILALGSVLAPTPPSAPLSTAYCSIPSPSLSQTNLWQSTKRPRSSTPRVLATQFS